MILGGIGGYLGPGSYVPMSAWYSLRALNRQRASGTFNAVNVRRDSDNATTDLLLLSTGYLDVATATTFAAGANLFVVTWYDQAGIVDVTQATSSKQPALKLTGGPDGALPHVQFDGVDDELAAGSALGPGQPWTYSGVMIRTSGTALTVAMANFLVLGSLFGFNSANRVTLFAGTLVEAIANDNAWHAVQGVGNGASGDLYVDGVSTPVNAGNHIIETSVNLGANTGAGPLAGSIYEIGYASLGMNPAQEAAVNANQHAMGVGW